MGRVLLFMGLFLAACNAPSPYFRGAGVTRVSLDGSTFDIRQRGRLAEAVRVNAEYAPRLGPIGQRAELAMEAVTGCDVVEIRGDAAQVLGIMDCGDGSGRVPLASYAPLYVDCDVVDIWVPSGNATGYIEAEC
ncbi:hypothetical protein [Thiosulfatihalobacter marinus]|uniref:hypothetical protein n=1 Tax=Thiosulfatihalobacter marinus TaxID=2792481 RepID=UPI0018D8E89D|nr:hypothetical protein [Thiosulfatihalobacter marinus]